MNKILFDLSVCQPIGSSKFHGGGIYGYIVFKALIKKNPERIVAYYDSSRFIPEDIKRIIKKYKIICIDSSKIRIIDAYRKEKCKILYSPLYNPTYESLISQKIPLIVTIHGLRALEINRDRKEWLYSKSLTDIIKAIIKQTPIFRIIQKKYFNQYRNILNYDKAKIVTVSNHSRASILSFYPKAIKSNISVRYSPNTSENTNEKIINNIFQDYYLIISADRWIKNSYRALKAFDSLYTDHLLDKPVYVVGINENSLIAKRLKNKNQFHFFHYMDRQNLEQILSNAYALVYPSLNEGFGYPPLEVMRYGVPVLASGIASIPEICADAVIYFNPFSEQEIRNRIIQINNSSTHDIYSKKSLIQYEKIKIIQEKHLEKLLDEILNYE